MKYKIIAVLLNARHFAVVKFAVHGSVAGAIIFLLVGPGVLSARTRH